MVGRVLAEPGGFDPETLNPTPSSSRLRELRWQLGELGLMAEGLQGVQGLI